MPENLAAYLRDTRRDPNEKYVHDAAEKALAGFKT